MEEKILKKDRAHTRYYVTDEATGRKVRVPGVTTITGVFSKPALKGWANRIGLEGIDLDSYVDTRANMGTCAHDMVEAHLLEMKPDLSEFSPAEVAAAENSLLSFHESMRGVEYKIIGVEMTLVSQKHRFGGTCDIYWLYNGRYRLTDLKTSKNIYPDQWTQVAAYGALLKENGHQVDEISILNIPRGEDEAFKHETIGPDALRAHWQRFLAGRQVYELNKEVGIRSW